MSSFSKRKMRLSAFSGVKQFRLEDIMLPAVLNNLSEGTLEPVNEKYFFTR